MSRTPPRWIIHLLCAGVGVGFWPVYRSLEVKPSSAGTVDSESPATEEMKRRHAELRASHGTWRPEEPFTPLTPEQRLANTLKHREERAAANQTELAELLARSARYREVADLAPLLTEALIAVDDDFDYFDAAAIFVEWHRRDPRGAFDEMARRERSSNVFIFHEALFLHVSPEELIHQLSIPSRPGFLREQILSGFGELLARSDDLGKLASAMQKLDASTRSELARQFVGSDWIPRDGVATLIAAEMPVDIRKSFLTAILSSSSGTSGFAWADGPGKELTDTTLGPAEAEQLRQKVRAISIGGCWGGGEEFPPGEDPVFEPLPPGLSEDEVVTWLSVQLWVVLEQGKDYCAALAEGEATVEEIFEEAKNKISGAGHYPELLAREIYRKVAPHNPSSAAAWASDNLPAADFAKQTRDIIRYTEDPRTSARVRLIRMLPPQISDDEFMEWTRDGIHSQFEDWRALDPVTADAALKSIPAAHPLRKAAEGAEYGEEEEP